MDWVRIPAAGAVLEGVTLSDENCLLGQRRQ